MNTTPDGTLVEALRAAVQADPGVSTRPGQLRPLLEVAVSPKLRPQVHQVAAAAEENIPASLVRMRRLGSDSLTRLGADLAQTRGWSHDVSVRVIRTWALALGVDEVVPAPDRDQR